MTKIKICGITRREDAQLCAALGVEYLGFVFVRESKRYVEAEWVREMAGEKGYLPCVSREPKIVALLPRRGEGARRADEGPLRVGVFRDSPLDEVRRIAEIARLDLIQLHGAEDEEYVRAIALPVIRAVDASRPVDTGAPYVMFDNGGGTGRTFDWSLIESNRPSQPFFLAGGLTPGNVGEAIRVTRPYAVDVSTGVESAPGVKDPQKIRDFLEKVRQP